MKYCYAISKELSAEIEMRMRNYGSQLVSREYICSLQYYYQQTVPSNGSIDRDVPAFTIVSIQDKPYIISEVIERKSASSPSGLSLTFPLKAIDICEIDPSMFDKMNIFSLKSKTAKRVRFRFSKYIIDQSTVLLGDDCVIFPDGLDANAKQIVFGNHMNSAKSLNLNEALLRPTVAGLELPLWIYQLGKLSQRVFPQETAPVGTIEFSDCVFAKDLFLV